MATSSDSNEYKTKSFFRVAAFTALAFTGAALRLGLFDLGRYKSQEAIEKLGRGREEAAAATVRGRTDEKFSAHRITSSEFKQKSLANVNQSTENAIERLRAERTKAIKEHVAVAGEESLESLDKKRADGDSRSFVQATRQNGGGLSACLLAKDINHMLVEWIAYHWLVLPLQHLVIAVDPQSKTTPADVITRWNESVADGGMGMDINLWYIDDWVPEGGFKDWFLTHRPKNKAEASYKFVKFQNYFMSECMKYHKRNNRTWVLMTDPDEFISLNYVLPEEKEENIIPERRRHPPFGNVTIGEFLLKGPGKRPPCIGFPSLRFGSRESNASIVARGAPMDTFDPKQFLTTRFFFPNPIKKNDKLKKTIIDVSRIPHENLQRDRVKIVHSPVPECGKTRTPFENGLIRINHYTGSWESYIAQNDGRRNVEEFAKRALLNESESPHGSYGVQPWLKMFVDVVGEKRALRLLNGTGRYHRRDWEPYPRLNVSEKTFE